ncbi:MAG: hypothetical protein M9887_12175 [Chitinophagales bacterium]|nr:hypothetical protein [Chitinophagales bacterium]
MIDNNLDNSESNALRLKFKKSMSKAGHFLFIICSMLLISCSHKKDTVTTSNSDVNYIDEDLLESKANLLPVDTTKKEVEDRKIKDGVYTADIEYYNTTTGVNTLYVTKVHVENGYLKVVKWPDGVWLASEYFEPEKIKKDGTCIIKNVSGKYENRVRILDLEFE